MLGKRFKARVKIDHPAIREIFPLGFETELQSFLTDEDKVVPPWIVYNHVTGEVYERSPGYTIPKGSYEHIIAVGNNGEDYGSALLYNCTGKPVAEIFEKLEEIKLNDDGSIM